MPRLTLFSSAISARAASLRDVASDFIILSAGTRSSSSSARRATALAKSRGLIYKDCLKICHKLGPRSEKECGLNDTPFVPTVISSNRPTPVAKESGANTHPWQTPSSIVN